jgi:hypothetical protein
MCTEFILASIYFSIIFIINFLLVKLLLSYKKSLTSLFKFKKIFNFYEKKNLDRLLFLKKMEKRESKLLFSINNVKNFSDTEDILIIGNTYKIFSKNTINFYFPLLKLQYLFEVERDIDKVRKE